MKSYFHVAANMLGDGAVVLPGNYGRNLKSYSTGPQGQKGNFYALARELIFEGIRVSEFEQKPSRLESCFMFESYEDAQKYGRGINEFGVIYEATIIDPAAKTHRGDFTLFQSHNLRNQSSFWRLYERVAYEYWSNMPQHRVDDDGKVIRFESVEVAEIVTQSPIRLERIAGYL